MDDFHGAKAAKETASQEIETFLAVCKDLGIPLAMQKHLFGLMVEYLGILIDSEAWTLRLSESKHTKLKALVKDFLVRDTATRKDVRSIIGKLLHASIVFRHGGTFCRGLLYSLKSLPKGRKLHLKNLPLFRFDLEWWDRVLESPGQRSITENLDAPALSLSISTGHESCSATLNQSWLRLDTSVVQDICDEVSDQFDPSTLDLTTVLAACATWGNSWKGHRVELHLKSTHKLSCTCIAKRTSKNLRAMTLLRRLFFLEVHFDFVLILSETPHLSLIHARMLASRNYRDWLTAHSELNQLPTPVTWDLIPDFGTDDICLPPSTSCVFPSDWCISTEALT